MKLPGTPDGFQLPEDPGEALAWMKNFAEKLPQYAEKLEIPAEDLAMVQSAYEQMRAAKEVEDKARLKRVEQELCKVPDGWPPPPVLHDLMRAIPAIPEPERTQMLKEIERWSAAIVRAQSPRLAPKLTGGYFDQGIVIRVELPEPCRWSRYYYRAKGAAAWRFLAITSGDYYLHTDPAMHEEGDEEFHGVLEFIVIGMLPHEDPTKGWAAEYGAPSAVLAVPVPTEYPVPAAQ